MMGRKKSGEEPVNDLKCAHLLVKHGGGSVIARACMAARGTWSLHIATLSAHNQPNAAKLT